MRAARLGAISVLLLCVSTAAAEPADSAPPIVEQVLAHATALALSDTQIQALQAISDRRRRTLATLTARLQASATQSTAAAQHDTVELMQEVGRLQVLSGREALQQLTPAQRRRWVELQAQQKP